MAHLIVKDRKLCVVNGRLVTSADGAPCVCGGCASLPDNIKLTLSGHFELTERNTVFDSLGNQVTTERHSVTFPELEITMSRSATGYFSLINCDAPMSGNISLIQNAASPFNEYGALTDIVSVGVSVRPSFDPVAPCKLWTITVQCRGRYSDNFGNTDDLFAFYTAHYYTLADDVVGLHNQFGNGIPSGFCNQQFEQRPILGCIAGPSGGGVFEAESKSPPNCYTEDPFQNDRLEETSHSGGWRVEIEAYEGPPICDANPFTTALRCDGSGSELVVDLRDAIDSVPSSPAIEISTDVYDLYQPTGNVTIGPADITLWVAEVCEEQGFAVYQNCADAGDEIAVDETNKPPSSLTAMIGPNRYFPTGGTTTDTPVAVVWSDDPCPSQDNLWRRCDDPSVYVRLNLDASVLFMSRDSAGVWMVDPNQPGRECRDIYRTTFERVLDDGRTAPLLSAGDPASECAPRTLLGQECRGIDRSDPPFGENDLESPAGRSGLPLVDLSGFDPTEEARRLRQGGCCGQPSNDP